MSHTRLDFTGNSNVKAITYIDEEKRFELSIEYTDRLEFDRTAALLATRCGLVPPPGSENMSAKSYFTFDGVEMVLEEYENEIALLFKIGNRLEIAIPKVNKPYDLCDYMGLKPDKKTFGISFVDAETRRSCGIVHVWPLVYTYRDQKKVRL